MRVLLDTDVVLDFVLEREPFAGAAGELFRLAAQDAYNGYVSGITPVNVFYLGRKVKGAASVLQVLRNLLAVMRVCPVNQHVLNDAFALPFSDYEDAVQHACAAASGLDAIVTRNLEDYKNATLPVFSPTDFLSHLKTQSS